MLFTLGQTMPPKFLVLLALFAAGAGFASLYYYRLHFFLRGCLLVGSFLCLLGGIVYLVSL